VLLIGDPWRLRSTQLDFAPGPLIDAYACAPGLPSVSLDSAPVPPIGPPVVAPDPPYVSLLVPLNLPLVLLLIYTLGPHTWCYCWCP